MANTGVIRKRASVGMLLLAAMTAGSTALAADAATDVPLNFLNIHTIKPEQRERFVALMRNNATQSHKEPANIVFDISEPGASDPTTLVLFESWKDQAGYDRHEASAHVAPVLAAVPEAFAKPERKIRLRNAPGLPAPARKQISNPSQTRNVVVRFELKPEQRGALIKELGDVMRQARTAPGNLVFNVYQDRADENAYVLYERWETPASHERHLAQAYSKQFDAQLAKAVRSKPEVWTLRDRIAD